MLSSPTKGTKDVDAVFNSSRATSLIETVAKGGLGMAKDAANNAAAYAVYAAPYVCAGDPVPLPPSPSPSGDAPPLWKSGIAMVAYGSLFVLAVFVWAQKYRGRTAKNISKSVDHGRSKSDDLNYAFLEGVGDDKQLLDRVGGSSLGADLAAKEEREQVRTTRTRALRKITALSSLTPCSPSRLTGTTP